MQLDRTCRRRAEDLCFGASMSYQAGGFDHLTAEITQLRQSTNELGDCQVELGRYQFLEDKEKRKKRIRHLNVECHSQQKQGNSRNRCSL